MVFKFEFLDSATLLAAGEYFVGDPCYVLTEENGFKGRQILEETKIFNAYGDNERDPLPREAQHGLFEIGDYRIGVSSTHGGDGCFEDPKGRSYPVDAGMLGVIPAGAIKNRASIKPNGDYTPLGHIVEFTKPFTVDYEDGVIKFGDTVEIDTPYAW